ncbi:hypothetical protein NECAME_08124 [Necator americanus]|uniref:Uncharacterized protein n=1 Tax=Necator americanus TaxID=51031 RepID=W2TK08_NECAM|nr:hypothetical protein NECAME_08124 [Necator americanus]ETN82133.1 hypothetical protein NECAME_08124 [Necator americanus]
MQIICLRRLQIASQSLESTLLAGPTCGYKNKDDESGCWNFVTSWEVRGEEHLVLDLYIGFLNQTNI